MNKEIKNKDYDEYYAKRILENYFPNKYGVLNSDDKPDLQNKNFQVGIEVTNAIEQQAMELEHLRTSKYKNEEARKRKILSITNDRYLLLKKYRDFIYRNNPQDHPGEIDPYNIPMVYKDHFDLILEAIKKKLVLINTPDHYTIFETNEIFIFSHIYAVNEMIEKAIYDIKSLQKGFKIKFDTVYVLVSGSLYILDLNQVKYSTINISNEEQFVFTHKVLDDAKKAVPESN